MQVPMEKNVPSGMVCTSNEQNQLDINFSAYATEQWIQKHNIFIFLPHCRVIKRVCSERDYLTFHLSLASLSQLPHLQSENTSYREDCDIKQVTYVKVSSYVMERGPGICKLLFLVLVRLYVATLARVMCTGINNKPSEPRAGCVPSSYENARMEGCMAHAVTEAML